MNRKRVQEDVFMCIFSFLGAGVRVEISKIQNFFLKVSREDAYKDLFSNVFFHWASGRSEQIENAISRLCTSRLVHFVDEGRKCYYETTGGLFSRGYGDSFVEDEVLLIKEIADKMLKEISYRPSWHFRS